MRSQEMEIFCFVPDRVDTVGSAVFQQFPGPGVVGVDAAVLLRKHGSNAAHDLIGIVPHCLIFVITVQWRQAVRLAETDVNPGALEGEDLFEGSLRAGSRQGQDDGAGFIRQEGDPRLGLDERMGGGTGAFGCDAQQSPCFEVGASFFQGAEVSALAVDPDSVRPFNNKADDGILFMLQGDQTGGIVPGDQGEDQGTVDQAQMVAGQQAAAFCRYIFNPAYGQPGKNPEEKM